MHQAVVGVTIRKYLEHLKVITLAQEHRIRKHDIDHSRMGNQIAGGRWLIRERCQTMARNNHSQVLSQRVKRTEIAMQVGRNGLLVEHLNVVTLKEGINHQLPVHPDPDVALLEVMTVVEAIRLKIIA